MESFVTVANIFFSLLFFLVLRIVFVGINLKEDVSKKHLSQLRN